MNRAINSLRSIEEKTAIERFKNKLIFLREEVGIQNLLIGTEKKLLQWCGHVERMNKERIIIMVSKVK
jgi:hypothetical protein